MMFQRYRHTTIVAALIAVLVLIFSQCVDNNKNPPEQPVTVTGDVRGPEYAGAAACGKCHRDIHRSYLATAHQQTSTPPSSANIKGSFDAGRNTYQYRDNVEVRMEKRDSGLYQVAYMNNQERAAFPFGTVIGSGRKAQTYLYWYGDNAFQLPVSYSIFAGNWVNSPNYPPDKVRFDRLINVGCFECHGSYIKLRGTQKEGERFVDYFDKSKVIYGIDCERCHGPAKEHVNFHEKNPQEKKAQSIKLYNSLPRQARLDLCAQCHSGAHPIKQTIFSFKPGDTLGDYFTRTANDDLTIAPSLDVHGNQYQLMAASACFKKSTTLDCASCHNSHTSERDNMKIFSDRCINCHKTVQHSFSTPAIEKDITNNCVDCHMPAAPSKVSMKSEDQAEASPNLVRTHYVTVYRDATQRYLDSLKKR
jgi:hypothetical protein